jgi:hypothetical protein
MAGRTHYHRVGGNQGLECMSRIWVGEASPPASFEAMLPEPLSRPPC